ncbi:MAG: sensor histidine kinase, partial [Eubacterium ventriosum]|uniref:sensor histidine kinase n=1 Tax=Eubacterium ventriosum TaxID=39496 RepID=UPI001D578BCB
MRVFMDKLALLISCFLFQLYYYKNPGTMHVLALLAALTFICLCTYCNPDLLSIQDFSPHFRYLEIGLCLFFLVPALTVPLFTCFLPLLFYELTLPQIWCLIPAGIVVFLLSDFHTLSFSLLLFLLMLLAFWLKQKTVNLLQLEQEFKRLRDTSTEYNLLLREKNQELLKQQDYEIHVATLKERNRIAREIHDNVGHILSRSILQSGALIAINKDPVLKEPLSALKDTLSLAMNSIRESVHDLHDDSVDLKSTLQTMLKDFSDYEIHLEYDMGALVPKNIKYCFIAIAKEALSNVTKH